MSRTRGRFGTIALLVAIAGSPRGSEAQALRLRADALAEARSPAGLVMLQGQDRDYPWFDAEALVWGGARSDVAGDVLVLTMRLREPHGYGELRGGRFIFATGAIRPVHVDGVSAIGRLPGGLTVEAVSGALVAPRFEWRAADWLAGGRLSQRIGSRATIGGSYWRQNAREGLAHEEIGADMAAVPFTWLDVAAKGAYDVISQGVAEANVSAAARLSDFRVELFATHRSPSRLLPATSLFSVLGDFPSQIVGSTIRWAAAPRLDLLASAAGQDLGGDLGGFGFVRGTLRLDDEGDGSLGVELRRQDVAIAHWTGVRMIAAERLASRWRASTELELARADDAEGRSTVFPWGLAALGWQAASGWEAAAAVEAGSTPKYRFEVEGLLRIAYSWSRP